MREKTGREGEGDRMSEKKRRKRGQNEVRVRLRKRWEVRKKG